MSCPPSDTFPAHPRAGLSAAEVSAWTRHWRSVVSGFNRPCWRRATWQLVTSLGLYGALWFALHLSLAVSWWLTVPLACAAGAALVRIFIIFHDCGHGSFLPSRTANAVVGFVTGLLTLTPFNAWRREHAAHHATSGDLDRRGTGDIWTMTLAEYRAATPRTRFAYRFARHPLVLFTLGPLALFVFRYRLVPPEANRRERWSTYATNLALAALVAAMCWWFGPARYLALQLIITMVSGAIGFWMFYVQHQFEDAYWVRHEEWDFMAAAMQGSSYYQLPRWLQWITGNIGFHHIHHLSASIPNYRLEACHRALPAAQAVHPITLRASLRTLSLRLWDEDQRRMVGFPAEPRAMGVVRGQPE